MKKLIQLTVIFLLGGFIFSSCSSNLSITKRRYNKGYFVHHNSGKHHVKKENDRKSNDKVAVNEQEKLRAVEYVKRTPEAEVTTETKQPVTAAATKPQTFSKEQKKEMRAQTVNMVVKHPVKAIKRVGELTKQDSGDRALSLLWVVVVVILIVYLLGLLLDWGGGGNLIHILGIIALVLLILWLLRIL
jgi:Flp pilus assembly protein TadB